jgi:chromosome partitioning protein
MRRIAVINQKGGVGKTTTTANLGAALAIQGRRVVVVDMDAQANLSLALGTEAADGSPTSYSVLVGRASFAEALRSTSVPGMRLVASHIDLSGAELELASAMAREYLLRDALSEWQNEERERNGRSPADYVLFDCPPSLGLLSINALAAADEVLITLQTEFLAMQGMTKLVDIVRLLKKRLNPGLEIAGILPCLYDSRLKLAREVLGEIRAYFKALVLPQPVRSCVKLAEAPSFGQTIFEYAPSSPGAVDYMRVARELIARESRDPELGGLPAFDEEARLPSRREPTRTLVPAARTTQIAAKTAKAPARKRDSERASTPAAQPVADTRAPAAEPPRVHAPQVQAPPIAPAPVPAPEPEAETAALRTKNVQRRARGPAPKTVKRPRSAAEVREASAVAADLILPLPPDAFEILNGPPFEP